MNTQIIIALLLYYIIMKYDFNDNHFSVEIKNNNMLVLIIVCN